MAGVPATLHSRMIESAPWGLRLISDTTSEIKPGSVAVDIVAVHGLGANPDHAWVRHQDHSVGLETDVRWLEDLLPQTFREYKPNVYARIFCFNYQSVWLGSQLSRNRLDGIARRLLDDIHNARDKDGLVQRRPLIFIGHSFGGLVIEHAIVQANSGGGRYAYLVKLTGGVLLLGTPHQGSKLQKWGSIIANLANLMDHGEPGLMNEVDEKSMRIFDLVSEFKRIMISTDLAKTAVICFYENRPTDYLSRVSKAGQWLQKQTSSMVVEEVSAVLPGFQSIVLDSDHLKLNKYPSAQDGNYVSVSSHLCRIAATAPELIHNRRKGQASHTDSYFIVPSKRVKDFIGRECLLDEIRSRFTSHEIELPSILILYALGGQGKSQLALEYCRRWRDTYHGVFWIDANSATTVTQSYSAIATEVVGGQQIETSDSDVLIRMVKGHLERWSEAWLLVFDNYDDPKSFPEVKQFIPTRGCGHVLFTSRIRDLGRLGTPLEIPSMTTEEGVRLLLRGYNEKDVQPRHRIAASSIVDRLGRLALAIDQAAAYINFRRMALDRLEDFRATYEAERKKILAYSPHKFWEYEHINAFTTWELSFQQLGSVDDQWREEMEHFLTLSAFFAPTIITESLFRHYHHLQVGEVAWLQMFTKNGEIRDAEIGEDEDEIEDEDENIENSKSSSHGPGGPWDSDQFWHVIASSEELSLLQSTSQGNDKEGAEFSLHPLIQDWLQLRLQLQDRARYTQEAIQVLCSCAEAYIQSSATLEEKTALITHMDASLSNDEKYVKLQDRLGHYVANCTTANNFAWAYGAVGRYRISENLYRLMVKTLRVGLSEKHPMTLKSMDYLATTLDQMGKFEEAERIQRRTLTLREMELGLEHLDTLDSMTSLASVFHHRGKDEEAESMFRRVFTLKEAKLGSEHLNTLTTMSGLASVLMIRGKYEEAEPMFRLVLEMREEKLGREHYDTLESMNNFTSVLCAQYKYQEAETLQRRGLTLSEKVLGKEHPITLTTKTTLAFVLKKQSKFEEAEQSIRETLLLSAIVLGKEHPSTLKSMNLLALTLAEQNKDEDAEQLLRETLILRKSALGEEHPDTLTSMNNLATTLVDQNKYDEAEQLLRDTYFLQQLVSGKEHPNTLTSMSNLARVLKDQGAYEEAVRILRQLLILSETVLGDEHPDTIETREMLVDLLRIQIKVVEAQLIASTKEMATADINDPKSEDSDNMATLPIEEVDGPRQWGPLSEKEKEKDCDGGGEDEDDENHDNRQNQGGQEDHDLNKSHMADIENKVRRWEEFSLFTHETVAIGRDPHRCRNRPQSHTANAWRDANRQKGGNSSQQGNLSPVPSLD